MDRRAETRSMWIIWITIFIDLMGVTLIIPYINDFVADLGGDERQVGFLLASYAVMQLLFAPVWGRISDRVGRRPIIIIGLGTSAVAFTIFGLADQLWLLFASRMLAGMANANISVAQAFVADITPPEKRAGRMGLVGAAFNLGFIVGFPVGGILATLYGNMAPALLAAGLSAVNCLAALFILPESLPKKARQNAIKSAGEGGVWAAMSTSFRHLADYWQRPAVSRILTSFLLYTVAFSTLHVVFVEYTRDIVVITPMQRGFVFMFIGVVGALVQFTAIQPMVARTIFAVISQRSSESEQGVAMGVTQSLGALGRVIGPPYGGLSYALLGYRFPFISAAVIAVLSLAVYAGRRE